MRVGAMLKPSFQSVVNGLALAGLGFARRRKLH
jgi:hypothetical protein